MFECKDTKSKAAMPSRKRSRTGTVKKLVVNYKQQHVKSRKHARKVTSDFHEVQVCSVV